MKWEQDDGMGNIDPGSRAARRAAEAERRSQTSAGIEAERKSQPGAEVGEVVDRKIPAEGRDAERRAAGAAPAEDSGHRSVSPEGRTAPAGTRTMPTGTGSAPAGHRTTPTGAGKAPTRMGKAQAGAGSAPEGHRPSARERLVQAKEEQKQKKKRRRRIIAMIAAECLTLTCIFAYAFFARTWDMAQKPSFNKSEVQNEDLALEDLTKMKGYWMIAVFGLDSRGSSTGAGNQSDVNMIICVNQDTGEIKMVSLYRDTYLQTGDNRYSKFNEAYARGGPEQALKYLNRNLDLNITDYISFNWKAVADAIDILGGVDIEISKAEFKYINAFISETVQYTGKGSVQLKNTGMNHLDGVQAVAYGRLRLMDSDYSRVERQKKVIMQAFEKAKKASYADLNNILVTVLPQVSHNLDFGDLTTAALSITKYYLGESYGFPSARGDANMGSKGLCIIPQTLVSNVKDLHTFLFGDVDYEPTDTVKRIGEKISADSGMYKTGTPFTGKISTEGYLPPETKAPETKPAETTEADSETEETTEPETDAEGNLIIPGPTKEGEDGNRPGIGETDADGNLIDGPEDEEPESSAGIWDQNGQGNIPGENNPGNNGTSGIPGGSGTNGTGTNGTGGTNGNSTGESRPLRPGDEVPGVGPGAENGTYHKPTHPGDTGETTGNSGNSRNNLPGGSTYPGNSGNGGSTYPGGSSGAGTSGNNGNTPGGSTGSGNGGTTPGGSTTPGGGTGTGNSGNGSTPGGSTIPGGDPGIILQGGSTGNSDTAGNGGAPGADGPGGTT